MSGITNFRPQGGGDYVPTEYTATKAATATCPRGSSGDAVTRSATRTSNSSQVDADSRAYQAALALATAALVCVIQYGTELIGPSDEGSGISFRSGGAEILRFDELSSGESLPSTMNLTVGGLAVATIVYMARYAGKRFSFSSGGASFAGVFTSGTLAL